MSSHCKSGVRSCLVTRGVAVHSHSVVQFPRRWIGIATPTGKGTARCARRGGPACLHPTTGQSRFGPICMNRYITVGRLELKAGHLSTVLTVALPHQVQSHQTVRGWHVWQCVEGYQYADQRSSEYVQALKHSQGLIKRSCHKPSA